MARRVSEYLGVDSQKFEDLGVFDAVIGVDTLLFLDPHLLGKTSLPEFSSSRYKIIKYYQSVITLILASQKKWDRPWREAYRRLIFRETKGISIGYSLHRSDGSGIGPELALKLIESAQEIISLGVKDPEIFELLGLFEEDFGADRLSDMAISIIREDIYAFTSRIALGLKANHLTEFRKETLTWMLPVYHGNGKPILLLPKELLRDLPVALTWEGIDYVVSTNRELRERINRMIGFVWKNKITKRQLRDLILRDKNNIETLVDVYKRSRSNHYDFKNDPKGEVLWYYLGHKYCNLFPIIIKESSPADIGELESVVVKIIKQFKKNIEVNGLNEHLYVDGKLRRERFSQLLFFSTADTYCSTNNVDISREPNAGRGPVDFKLSRGYGARILVEVKLSSNKQLVNGFRKQLPIYAESEDTVWAIYLIIRTTNSDKQIKRIYRLQREARKRGEFAPAVWVVDGRQKPSASKRKQ